MNEIKVSDGELVWSFGNIKFHFLEDLMINLSVLTTIYSNYSRFSTKSTFLKEISFSYHKRSM